MNQNTGRRGNKFKNVVCKIGDNYHGHKFVKLTLFADEFIAADLTLYSNPLNKALNMVQAPPAAKKEEENKKEGEKEKKEDVEEDIVAADLTKYDSPMSQMDRKHHEAQKKK